MRSSLLRASPQRSSASRIRKSMIKNKVGGSVTGTRRHTGYKYPWVTVSGVYRPCLNTITPPRRGCQGSAIVVACFPFCLLLLCELIALHPGVSCGVTLHGVDTLIVSVVVTDETSKVFLFACFACCPEELSSDPACAAFTASFRVHCCCSRGQKDAFHLRGESRLRLPQCKWVSLS